MFMALEMRGIMYRVKPLPTGEHYLKHPNAIVTVYALAANEIELAEKANKIIAEDGWEIVSVAEKAFVIPLERCGSQEAKDLFHKASFFGVAALYVATGIDESGTDFSSN